MVTLKKEVKITGNGLMKNKPCEVTLFPSKTGQIRYFVKDKDSFTASVDNVIATDHCVVLGTSKVRSMLTEHLTAALAFCHIDSVDICMTEEEVPALDGSSKGWVEAIKSAGIDKPFFAKEKSYAVNYNHTDLTRRFVNYDPKKKEEIIEARTFGFYHDLKKFQMLGFAQGVTEENTVGLTDERGYTTELRSEHEPIKHKMLDLVGDLYLSGVNPLNLKCQILAKEAGHAVHVKVAKMLKDKLIEI